MKTNIIDFSDPNGVSEGVLTHSTTAPQAWVLPDNTGTIALTSDIPNSSSIVTYDSAPPSNPQLGDIWEDTSRSHPHSDRWIYMTCGSITDWWSELQRGGGGRSQALTAPYSVGETSPTYSANTIYILSTQFRGRAGAQSHTASSYFTVNAGYYSGAGQYVNVTSIPLGTTSGMSLLTHRWLTSTTPYLLSSTAAYFGVTVTPVGSPELLELFGHVVYRIRRT